MVRPCLSAHHQSPSQEDDATNLGQFWHERSKNLTCTSTREDTHKPLALLRVGFYQLFRKFLIPPRPALSSSTARQPLRIHLCTAANGKSREEAVAMCTSLHVQNSTAFLEVI
jgi:hypothetical protein